MHCFMVNINIDVCNWCNLTSVYVIVTPCKGSVSKVHTETYYSVKGKMRACHLKFDFPKHRIECHKKCSSVQLWIK